MQAKRNTKVQYQPKTRVTKPKSTSGGEFIEKESGKTYKGKYIEDFKGKFYAGTKIEDNGVELEKVKSDNIYVNTLVEAGLSLLYSALRGVFKKKPTQGDREKGTTKRYFVQDRNNNKITETSKDLYQQAKTSLPNTRFATVDWIIAGPAEDRNFNGYPYEGAASKNKKAIQALESQMPGISTFITDYSFLVEDPTANQKPILSVNTEVEKDPQVKLENDRKANFDLKK